VANGTVTIYDVAARAGVSISTVSHALNRPQRVGSDTLARVMQVIEELGFTPKAAAVTHARKGVGRIGVMAPFTSYESFRRRLAGVLLEAAERAVEVVVWDHTSAASATSPLLSSIPVARRLDGLLIMGVPLDDVVVERLAGSGLPAVLVDATHAGLSSVGIDDVAAGLLLGRHLVARGHTHIAQIGEHQRSAAYVSQGQQRRQGLAQALSEAGLPPENLSLLETETSDVAGGRAATVQLLEEGSPATALVGHHDELAAGIVGELRRRGRRVPEDYAVAGFDDGPLAEALDLTTVHQPLEESGRLATETLFAAIAAPQPVRRTTLEVQLRERATT
jgi:DNA-binding LacI/PurR family transcriptional regulator